MPPTCASCGGYVPAASDGTLPDHHRFADNANPAQPHVLVLCEGSGTTLRSEGSPPP